VHPDPPVMGPLAAVIDVPPDKIWDIHAALTLDFCPDEVIVKIDVFEGVAGTINGVVNHICYPVEFSSGCCIGIRGNANGDEFENVNVSDITYLVNYLFGIPGGDAPPCLEEGNANGDPGESIGISDITYLVDYLFGIPGGDAPRPCP
jgi:hypothetical protein